MKCVCGYVLLVCLVVICALVGAGCFVVSLSLEIIMLEGYYNQCSGIVCTVVLLVEYAVCADCCLVRCFHVVYFML